jgi:hypothetical protein
MVDATVPVMGCGPTGPTVAHELLRRGIGCRIVDKRPAPQSTTRAFTIDRCSSDGLRDDKPFMSSTSLEGSIGSGIVGSTAGDLAFAASFVRWSAYECLR